MGERCGEGAAAILLSLCIPICYDTVSPTTSLSSLHHIARANYARECLHLTTLLLAGIVLVAAMLQTLSGFGFALVVMPLAVHLVGIYTAAPFVAAIALSLYAINLLRQRQALDWTELRRLGVVAALGAPVGIWLLTRIDANIIRTALGGLLASYALYTLFGQKKVRPITQRWAYVSGFAAGCLGGAYNIPGPPLILYGSLRQWPHQRFRAVLQAIFLVNGMVVVGTHLLTRHYTQSVRALLWPAWPALLIGVALGARLDQRLPAQYLRNLIMILIFVLGLSLIVR